MNTIDHGPDRSLTTAAAAPLGATHAFEIDCDKVATVLDRVETGDASPAEVDYLIDHVQDCSPCFSSIDQQRLFIAFVQGNLRPYSVPASLMTAIRASIAQESVAQ